MGRELYSVEIGVQILSLDGATGVALLFGSAAPGGETYSDNAGQGSIYMRTNGTLYQKDQSGSGTDKWRSMASSDDLLDLSWRSEKVIVATGDTIAAGARDLAASPFSDDEGTKVTAADFAVGQYAIGGVGGTVKLFEVTDVSSPSVTFAEETTNPLADKDSFIVEKYLPDSPDDQEVQALVSYRGTTLVKLGDVNWSLATGINLSSGYSASSGDPAASDSVEVAIQKLDGNVDAVNTALGVAQGVLHFGTFTGDLFADSQTAKQLFQTIETNLEDLLGRAPVRSELNGVEATATKLDEVLVDDFLSAHWLVTAELDSDPARRISVIVHGVHNGTPSADASVAKDSVSNKLLIGAAFTYSVVVDLNGSGATQTMRLMVTGAAAAGVTFRAVRIDTKDI